MKYFITLLFFSISLLIHETMLAKAKKDSLLSVWNDTSLADSTRVHAFGKTIWANYIFSKPDSAFILVDQMLQFSRKNEYANGIAKSYTYKGTIYYVQGSYPEAIEFYSKGLGISKKIGDIQGQSSTLGNIGAIHILLGNYSAAIKYTQEGLDLALKNKDTSKIAAGYTNLGNIYYYQKEFEPALKYYKKSLTAIGSAIKSGLTNNNIGAIYIQLKKYKLAEENILRGIELSTRENNKLNLSESWSTMARLYAAQKKYNKAIEFYNKCLDIKKEIGDAAIGETLYEIGNTFNKKGDHQSAIKYCTKGLSINKNNKLLSEELNCAECLYKAYKSLGNSPKALLYHERSSEIIEALKQEETSKELQQLEYTKKIIADSIQGAEEKEKVALAHKIEVQEKDFNRNILLGVGLISLLLAGGFYSRWKFVNNSKKELEKEKEKSDNLLLNILPADIAHELKNTGQAVARNYENTTILFSDFKEFTQISEQMTATELVENINSYFKKFDDIMGKYGIEKIKTIGDAYMAVSGLKNDTAAAKSTILAALAMQDVITEIAEQKVKEGKQPFQMRVGVHSGPLVAGIVGVKKFQYDVWGDAVNTASRMESNGKIGEVNISDDTYELIKHEADLQFEARGKVAVKGKGEMDMYFVRRK